MWVYTWAKALKSIGAGILISIAVVLVLLIILVVVEFFKFIFGG